MRTIKFRGQREDTREWVYGDFIHYNEQFMINVYETEFGCWAYQVPIIPETIGQFTGLYDKNGKEIYECDILVCQKWIGGNWIDYCIESGYVEMKFGAFGLRRKQGYYRPFKDWLEDYEFEVIGNIYDNKELL